MARQHKSSILSGLNREQQAAVVHDAGPLLVIAGAGTGKTRTLVHRVAQVIHDGVPPDRVLLLTFTRRAAAEMLRRVDGLLRRTAAQAAGRRLWGGTFHGVATRLLRIHGQIVGLRPDFTIHDRSDSEDLLDAVRTELGLAKTDKRFPRKSTCLAIHSHTVSAQRPVAQIVAEQFPWCRQHIDDLQRLFDGYVAKKDEGQVLDYDDLLLFWHGLLQDPEGAATVRSRFDRVFVDEYQDTNGLQAGILKGLRPDGQGLTVVGDDAQSIYAFRAATVRNILDFPSHFPGTTVVKLEQNYRSTVPILEVTNRVIRDASEGFKKELWTDREGGELPRLVSCADESEQASFVAQEILERREQGIDLKRQAVLFRTSHHSMVLEAELARRDIPFVKFGGLKFIETAHIKDLLGFLRLAENPTDPIACGRVLQLLPGIGPKRAATLHRQLFLAGGDFAAWGQATVPEAATQLWPKLVQLLRELRTSELPLGSQIHRVRELYGPILEQRYDDGSARQRDLEQLEDMAPRYADRATLLAEVALDPPVSTEDLAGPPHLDDDYLILSTIHSAKGLEWDAVYVIHAADGNIPSDMATGSAAEIDEERRLFYVALTRAKSWLYVTFPLRYYHGARMGWGDDHNYAQLTRFIDDEIKRKFQLIVAGQETQDRPQGQLDAADTAAAEAKRRAIRGLRS